MVLKGSSKLFEQYFDEYGRKEIKTWGAFAASFVTCDPDWNPKAPSTGTDSDRNSSSTFSTAAANGSRSRPSRET